MPLWWERSGCNLEAAFRLRLFLWEKQADSRGKSGKTIEKTNEIRLRD